MSIYNNSLLVCLHHDFLSKNLKNKNGRFGAASQCVHAARLPQGKCVRARLTLLIASASLALRTRDSPLSSILCLVSCLMFFPSQILCASFFFLKTISARQLPFRMATLSYLNLHHHSPFSSLIITALLSNSKVLLEVCMLKFLELLLVHLGLLVVYVDNTLDDLKTVLHIVHRLGEERGEVVVLYLTENAIVSSDLQLGALDFKLEFFDF